MRFLLDCDVNEEFKRHLRRIEFYKDEDELKKLEAFIKAKLFNLIVWKADDEVIGHAIWHESNTEEHRRGDPRDKEDHEILEKLLGGKKDFVELHEVWLIKEQRGKGYGKEFFEFFEQFIRKRGYDSIVYYAYHPAAIAICRQRRYREAYGVEEIGLEGEKQTCYVFYLSLKKD
jgi:GNAT superfamily N-acetyltransferase